MSKEIITYDVIMPTLIRQCNLDKYSFVNMLRKQVKEAGTTKKELAEELSIPLTEVEHWFRFDKYHSFPNGKFWYDIKEVLQIETSAYDKELTTYIEADCSYDISNRIYDSNGICPTLTSTNELVILCKDK